MSAVTDGNKATSMVLEENRKGIGDGKGVTDLTEKGTG